MEPFLQPGDRHEAGVQDLAIDAWRVMGGARKQRSDQIRCIVYIDIYIYVNIHIYI